jgi:hypothetical protein
VFISTNSLQNGKRFLSSSQEKTRLSFIPKETPLLQADMKDTITIAFKINL